MTPLHFSWEVISKQEGSPGNKRQDEVGCLDESTGVWPWTEGRTDNQSELTLYIIYPHKGMAEKPFSAF